MSDPECPNCIDMAVKPEIVYGPCRSEQVQSLDGVWKMVLFG